MTIEELIAKGESFKIETSKPRIEYGDDMNIIYQPCSQLKNGDEVTDWVETSKRFIFINFPEDISYNIFEKVSDNVRRQADILKLVGILKSLKNNPDICKPLKANTVSTNITVNQSQMVNLMFVIETIKSEIGEANFNKIKEIYNSQDSTEEKNSKVLDKLKSLGVNVLSSIIANILTNPSIWG